MDGPNVWPGPRGGQAHRGMGKAGHSEGSPRRSTATPLLAAPNQGWTTFFDRGDGRSRSGPSNAVRWGSCQGRGSTGAQVPLHPARDTGEGCKQGWAGRPGWGGGRDLGRLLMAVPNFVPARSAMVRGQRCSFVAQPGQLWCDSSAMGRTLMCGVVCGRVWLRQMGFNLVVLASSPLTAVHSLMVLWLLIKSGSPPPHHQPCGAQAEAPAQPWVGEAATAAPSGGRLGGGVHGAEVLDGGVQLRVVVALHPVLEALLAHRPPGPPRVIFLGGRGKRAATPRPPHPGRSEGGRCFLRCQFAMEFDNPKLTFCVTLTSPPPPNEKSK